MSRMKLISGPQSDQHILKHATSLATLADKMADVQTQICGFRSAD
jgi:hypothetical protein